MSQPQPRLDDLRIERRAETASPSRVLPWLLGLVVAVLIAAAVWWFARPKGLVVQTAVARAESVTAADHTVLNASGYVTARREATVSSKIMGKVMEVLVEEGVRVKEGDVLARLDATNTEASLQLAHAQLAAAEAALQETRVRLREAEQELQRQTRLSQSNVAAQADFDHAEAAAHAWQARLAQQATERIVAERSVAIYERQLEDMVIRAPFAGVVTSKNAQPGEMISPLSSGGFTRTGICTIVDMDSLEIEIDVNESYINRVAPGQPADATLDAYPEWKIPCKVVAIIPTADRQKSTVRVRVGFDRLDPRILPQMSTKVAFHEAAAGANVARRGGVLVPKSAVRNDGGRDVVFVVREGRVERRAVSVERASGADVVPSAGVAAGEKVALDSPPGLTDGAAVIEPKS